MKKLKAIMLYACTVIVLPVCFTSCLKDKGSKKTIVYVPVFKTSADVRASIKSDAPLQVSHPGKMYVLGNYIFLNEVGQGVHIIDNSNPATPVNKAFIHIPGNEDIAVKENTLYADCFTDLMAIDITDPTNVHLKTFVPNIFPDRQFVMGYQLGENTVIAEWEARDTIVDIDVTNGQGIWRNGSFYTESPVYYNDLFYLFSTANASYNVPKSNSGKGVGGSMARFAIINNYLYTVTTSSLNVINIASSSQPQWVNKTDLNNGSIETIYPFTDKLFIGSQTGMHIYDVSNPEQPVAQGLFEHVRNCDPVIADENYAYVTLHAGTFCGGDLNELEVLNIQDLYHPTLIKDYSLISPHGLSKDGDLLFICDGIDGLKVFNAADAYNIQQLSQVSMAETYDVICINKIAIVSAIDGLYQFDYTDVNNIKQLSKITIQQ